MSRTAAAKFHLVEGSVLDSAARTRARVLAILHGGLVVTGTTQSDVAVRLGLRKSAVSQVFNGRGNINIDTLSEYLGAMGLEADLVVSALGENEKAMLERRPPWCIAVTDGDRDRVRVEHSNLGSWWADVTFEVERPGTAVGLPGHDHAFNSNDGRSGEMVRLPS